MTRVEAQGLAWPLVLVRVRQALDRLEPGGACTVAFDEHAAMEPLAELAAARGAEVGEMSARAGGLATVVLSLRPA
jgi:TusA-related sulfurtransferase